MTRGGGSQNEQHYRRLPAGLHGLRAEAVASDQRARLCAAMAELVAERGYGGVTVSDLARLARVSRPTFYELFDGKQECLLAAHEQIAAEMSAAVLAGYRTGRDERSRIHAALEAFLGMAAAGPQRTSLLVLGALGAGAAARRSRRRMIAALSRRIIAARGNGANRAGEKQMLCVLIGGVGEVSAARLRLRPGELPSLAEDLTDWAASYPARVPARLCPPRGAEERRRALRALQRPELRRERRSGGRLPSGRHELPRSVVASIQRERLIDAVARLAAEHGADGLSISAIARRAGVSHRTFYEIFATKQQALLAAVRTGAEHWLALSGRAYRAQSEDWPAAVAAWAHALLAAIASEPDYAAIAFVELPALGPEALALHDELLHAHMAHLRPGYKLAAHAGRHVAHIASEAILGAIWQLIGSEVDAGRAAQLPLIAPTVIFVALTPFLGAAEAARLARRAPAR